MDKPVLPQALKPAQPVIKQPVEEPAPLTPASASNKSGESSESSESKYTPGAVNEQAAKRLARLLVSEIKLYNEQKIVEARKNRNVYDVLKNTIDQSRRHYIERMAPATESMPDYFHQELVNLLCEGDPLKLGPNYNYVQIPNQEKAKTIARYTDISFPARVTAAKSYNLSVQIVPSEESISSGEFRQQPIRVTISIAAENFEIEGQTQAEISVPLSGKSPAAIFRLRGEAVGPGRIMIDFAQGGRPVGSVDLLPEIIAEHREITDMAMGRGEVGLSVDPTSAPDVVIKVFETRYADHRGKLHFVLFSANPKLKDLLVMDGDLGTQDLRSEVSIWVEEQLRSLKSIARRSNATAEEVKKVLSDIGYNLFEQLLPKKLQEMYWVLRQRGVKTVLILSDEPHIPWELIRPYRINSITGKIEMEGEFWGEVFALTHWLRGRPPAGQFSLNRIYALAVSGSGTAKEDTEKVLDFRPDSQLLSFQVQPEQIPDKIGLKMVDEELDIIRSLKNNAAEINILPARTRNLREVFEQGSFDLLHITSHGAFGGVNSSDTSAILMEDGPFSAAELSPRMAGAMRRASPLIFFNACQSGRIGFSLTRLGLWGTKFVELGCGAFIGSLWPVTDEAALAFTREFYKAMSAGMAIGEAVLQARLDVHRLYPNDPTWLAYCCFADPMAKISQNN
jgi:hypothetical protein